ncbi:MAG: hypothetical protein Q8P92_01685 [Candidatus Daviesbacteria bacterium]|nr:hypothetical protein [Candidatus Daviesbacteria bacterium]
MNRTKLAIESLSMDLKRVALGYHRGSDNMARRFTEEAIKRNEEIEISEVKLYLKKFIKSLPKILNQKDKQKLAEDVLTYSVIFQNYTTTQFP